MKGRLWRDFLIRALQRLWTGKELEDAERQMEQAADPAEASFALNEKQGQS